MAYPGNPSLPSEVRDRVVSTFRQSVDLFKQGRVDEVRAGCDLISKMDPLFSPAKKLIEKLANPATVVDFDALLSSLPAPGAGPLGEARAAFAARDFQRAIEICQSVLSGDPTNTTAQQLASDSSEKIEAEPFVAQFVDQARHEISSGNLEAAKSALDKARSLDDDHPAIKSALNALEIAKSGGGVSSGFDAAAAFADAFSTPAASEPASAAASSFDFASAFVVDSPAAAPAAPAPPPPSGGGTPATDFGFTFEEEQKPLATAIPEPVAAAPASSGGFDFGATGPADFDFGAASVDVSAEDQDKIKQYLAEGDDAYQKQEFQKAIDLWSRIFLIDVTHDEASQRIELARKKRLEVDQQVEELVVQGTLAFEKKDFATARMKFEEVLRLDPSHFNANEYLEKLNEAQASPAAFAAFTPPTPGAPSAAKAPAASSLDDMYDDYQGSEEVLTPPDEAAAPARSAKARVAAPATKSAKKGVPKGAVLGGVAALVVILAAAGWFMFGPKKPTYDPAKTQAEFARAASLAKQGVYDDAIGVLLAVAPDDPLHDRALELIAEYKKQKAQKAGLIDGKPAAQVFQERLTKAREAFGIKSYLEAKNMFESAAAIQQLSPEDQANYQTATQQAAKLDAAQVLFKEGKYMDALSDLQPLLAQDPDSTSIKLLMSNAYFNLGRQALEGEQLTQAAEYFGKVLEYNPQDEAATRSRDFALRYDNAPKDLAFRIYVKYLPLR